MEPLTGNNDAQVPYHHKIEPSEITTSDDDTDDGQTSRNKRKKAAAPKKQPTRKPIQLKTYAHQFFLQQKELCGFRGKTNEAFVMYLLQAEEKRREYEKNQPDSVQDDDDSLNKRILKNAGINKPNKDISGKRRDELIELDRIIKDLKEENDVLKRTAEGWKHQCELLDNRLKLTERCLSTAEMNTNSILKQKEKLEEELYRYRSHLQAMMARSSEYITYGEPVPVHKLAKGYEQPHAYNLPPPKPESLKHNLSSTLEYPSTGQVEYIRSVGEYEMRDYAALPQYPPLTPKPDATIYNHPGYHQDVVNIGPSPPSDFMTILNMDYKQRGNVRQMKHDYHNQSN